MDILVIRSNFTTRLSCRKGDILFLLNLTGLLSPENDSMALTDYWRFNDGDFVTITNRIEDLPAWFELHPSEVSGKYARWMMKKLNDGYQPGEKVTAPNLWRIRAGDRLVWIGPKRTNITSELDVLMILECNNDSLVIGENKEQTIEALFFSDMGVMSEKEKEIFRVGHKYVLSKGFPRVAACDSWSIGG